MTDRDFQQDPGGEELIDPIGAELLVAIFSTVVSAVGVLHDFGVFSREHKRVLGEFKNLQEQINALQSTVDEFVLVVQKHLSHQSGARLENGPVTISSTRLRLKESDFHRWVELENVIKRIDQSVYALISNIREFSVESKGHFPREPFAEDLLQPFDEFMLNMGRMSFVQYVTKLRSLIKKLQERLNDLVAGDRPAGS